MGFKDICTSFLLGSILFGFKIYSKVATVVLIIFFPLTKSIVNKKLSSFGIEVNGRNRWDIKVHNEKRFYTRLAIEGTFGLMEGRIDKDWSTEDLTELFRRYFATRRIKEAHHPLTWTLKYFNLQTKARAWEVGQQHYDVGNDVIESMLDKNLQYTCGYWRNAKDLDEAQIAKMELIAKKLHLKPGMTVLDIGCGYGTLAYHLAKHYKVSVVGNSISKEQTKYAETLCEGLPCKFLLCDYRVLNEKFDRVVSVGMFEHVGGNNHKEFFEVCNRCLKDDGILLLHTIGISHKSVMGLDHWIHKYIFPNGYVPYYMEVCKAIEGMWVIEDWHNFGFDYSKTLAAWERKFEKNWPSLKHKYAPEFHTIWQTYLQAAQAAFLSRTLQLWQIVLTKDGFKNGYLSYR